jgi:hypothetical protein
MYTIIFGQDHSYLLRRPLNWLILIVLPMVLCPVVSVRAQDQSRQEKSTMANTSTNNKPPLDLQAPAVTETASFALG